MSTKTCEYISLSLTSSVRGLPTIKRLTHTQIKISDHPEGWLASMISSDAALISQEPSSAEEEEGPPLKKSRSKDGHRRPNGR